MPILPKVRDSRLITVRRGGSLTDVDHRLLAEWAATCPEHVLHLFEGESADDPRPRQAINAGRAWIRGEVHMEDARRERCRECRGTRLGGRPPSLPPYRRAKRPVAHVAAPRPRCWPPMQFALPSLPAHQTRRNKRGLVNATGASKSSSAASHPEKKDRLQESPAASDDHGTCARRPSAVHELVWKSRFHSDEPVA